MKNKEYIISPSELSYLCEHCAYLGKNFNLYPDRISAGITQTLDGMQKDYFLGDASKIDNKLRDGTVIDPYNISFYSKILYDNKKRPFRFKGKGDAIINFKDGTAGIIDYKTSKFKEKDGKDFSKNLEKKVFEYNPQLHAYSLLYSNLETDKDFLANKSLAKKPDSITKSVTEKLRKINNIKINKTKLLGLVFVYPEQLKVNNSITVDFSHKFVEVEINFKAFLNSITNYLDILHCDTPPLPTDHCGSRHNFFFDIKKLNKNNFIDEKG